MSEFSIFKRHLKKHIKFTDKRFVALKTLAGKSVTEEFTPRQRRVEFASLIKWAVSLPFEYQDEYLAGRVEALSAGQAAPHDLAIAIYLLFHKWPDFHHLAEELDEALFGRTDLGTIRSYGDVIGWSPVSFEQFGAKADQKSDRVSDPWNGNVSGHNLDKSVLLLSNSSNETVSLYWVDFMGSEKFYLDIKPLEKFSQPTFVSHVWLIRQTKSGKKIASVAMNSKVEEVYINTGMLGEV